MASPMRSARFGGADRKLDHVVVLTVEVYMYDGETVELLPYALEEGMGTEKASGLCGVRPRMAPTGLSGGCFAATRGHRASGTPGSRVGRARGRRDSAWQGWTGPQAAGDVPRGPRG